MNLFPILVMVMIKMVELLQEILEISITLSIRSLAQKSWRLVKASWFAARYPAETGYISWREHASSGSVGVSNSNATDQIPPSGRIAGSWRQTHGGSVHIFIDASWRENKARLAGVAIRGGGVCINSWFKCMDAASPSTGGEAHALLLASGSTARNPGWSGTFIFAFWREGCCTICCQGCTKTTTGDKYIYVYVYILLDFRWHVNSFTAWDSVWITRTRNNTLAHNFCELGSQSPYKLKYFWGLTRCDVSHYH